MDQSNSELACGAVFHEPLAESCSRSAIAKLLKITFSTKEIKWAECESQCDFDGRLLFLLLRLRSWTGVHPNLGSFRVPGGPERRWLLWTHQYFGWEARSGSKEHRTNRSGFGRTSNSTQCCGCCGTGAVLCQCDAGRLGRTQDRRSGINHPIACRPHRQPRILPAHPLGPTPAPT